MSETKDKERARQRSAVVFAVRSGQMTVEEGARSLGVSRKTYYEWESRAMQAMTQAMEDRSSGRPGTPKDEEKERLEEQLKELQNKLFVAEKTVEVRDMLHAYELQNSGTKKKSIKTDQRKRPKRKKP
jgi:transposase-like protein